MQTVKCLLRRTALALLLPFAATAGVAGGTVPAGQPVDGVHCDASEGVAIHIHPHLTILDHGKPVAIPEDVGRPIAARCLYWLHTHTPDGIVHIESPKVLSFTLGQFMDVWGEPLTATDVAGARTRKGERIKVYVQGRPYAGDPRKIEFTQHLDIVVLVGPPYRVPRPFTDWQGN